MMAGEFLKGGSTGWEQRGWTLAGYSPATACHSLPEGGIKVR